MLPAAASAGLADAVDAFCERIGFSPAQTVRVFDAARAHRLPVKLHADQLSDLGGARLAAQYRTLSADHLEHATDHSVRAMADAGTAAVPLPGAFYFLRETQMPPIAGLRQHKVPIAIATDCNPGTSPCTSPLLMLNRPTRSAPTPVSRAPGPSTSDLDQWVAVWSCLPPGVDTRDMVRPIVVGSSLRAKSPSETMPTSRLA